MYKAMLKLILAVFILGVINPGIDNAVVLNAHLNDYHQTCINKQSQVLPLVKNVQVKINIAGPDYSFTKPFWTGTALDCLAADRSSTALPKQSQNVHYQQHLQLLLYPPHFFG
ncbi:MAG: hypothetical protein V4577_15810 [Bacteroidota bacterium]